MRTPHRQQRQPRATHQPGQLQILPRRLRHHRELMQRRRTSLHMDPFHPPWMLRLPLTLLLPRRQLLRRLWLPQQQHGLTRKFVRSQRHHLLAIPIGPMCRHRSSPSLKKDLFGYLQLFLRLGITLLQSLPRLGSTLGPGEKVSMIHLRLSCSRRAPLNGSRLS